MKRHLIAVVLTLFALVPALAAQSPASFTGKWEGTFTMQRPDGTEGNPRDVVFDLTHKGKALTGTAGPPDRQWNIEKGAVTDGKATFEVDRLQGDMAGERDGAVRGHAKVDAARAKK
jgi:hypothetical protein